MSLNRDYRRQYGSLLKEAESDQGFNLTVKQRDILSKFNANDNSVQAFEIGIIIRDYNNYLLYLRNSD
jgi:hypothetical protein